MSYLKGLIRIDTNAGATYSDILNKYGHSCSVAQLHGLYLEIMEEKIRTDRPKTSGEYEIDAESAFWLTKAKKDNVTPYNIIEMFNMIYEGRKHLSNDFERGLYITYEVNKDDVSGKTNFDLNSIMGLCISHSYGFEIRRTDDEVIVSNSGAFNKNGFLRVAAECRLANKDRYNATVLDKLEFNKEKAQTIHKHLVNICIGNMSCQEMINILRTEPKYTPEEGHYYHTDFYIVTTILKLFEEVKRNGLNRIYDGKNLINVSMGLIK